MLIITVIVSASIKIIKTKLDNITSYTYYSAYQTVNSVTKEMLKDFRADDVDYVSLKKNKIFSLINLPAYAAFKYSCPSTTMWKYDYPSIYTSRTFGFGGSSWEENPPGDCLQWTLDNYSYTELNKMKICPGLHQNSYATATDYELYMPSFDYLDDPNPCTKPCMRFVWKGTGSDYVEWEGNSCGSYSLRERCHNDDASYIEVGQGKIGYCMKDVPDEPDSTCTPAPCTGGNEFDMDICDCVCKKNAPELVPCGKEWSEAQCGLVDRSPWPPTPCPAGQEFNYQDDVCDCVPIPQAIPRTGANYCKLFVSYANTSQLAEDKECLGKAIDANQTEFNPDDADMILRNGMILYNVSQDPEPIDVLSGNSQGRTYTKDDGAEIDIDEWGYTLYIDIDGARSGEGKLWEDVYPFYVTLSGTVIPAYDIDNPETAGGDSKLHLQTSVLDEYMDNSGRHTEWITKSRTFKDSACTMGYINPSTSYCTGISANEQCAQQNHDCRLKTIMPVKFFGY